MSTKPEKYDFRRDPTCISTGGDVTFGRGVFTDPTEPEPQAPSRPRPRQTLTPEQRAELREQTAASMAEVKRLEADSARLRFEIRVAELKRSGLRPSQAVFAAAAENREGYRMWLAIQNGRTSA